MTLYRNGYGYSLYGQDIWGLDDSTNVLFSSTFGSGTYGNKKYSVGYIQKNASATSSCSASINTQTSVIFNASATSSTVSVTGVGINRIQA